MLPYCVTDAQLVFDFTWLNNRFSACRNEGEADLTISASAHDFSLLARRLEDPDTLFLIGISEMQESHVERALEYWRPAFKRSPRVQERIATVLAGQMSLEFFEKEFQPEWKSFEIIGRAFEEETILAAGSALEAAL